ncbi:MAG: hypothetical protein OEZ40_02350 [Candidatus Bathyarchaeota archaeon]|nr:hypothetical protein [Candidatus Bathyarchaeota archaeon]
MKKGTREILAFALNFVWPGLGFYFSGWSHHQIWLRAVGIGLIAAFLVILPASVVATIPYPLINYHFTLSDLVLPLAVAFVFALLGF